MAHQPPVVVDTSVVAKWFFPEALSNSADGILNDCARGKISLAAPDLLVYEFTNLLWKRSGCKEIDREQAGDILQDFLGLPVRLAPADIVAGRALAIALKTGCTVYDGSFIALAEQLDSHMFTADRKLVNLVGRTGLRKRVRHIS